MTFNETSLAGAFLIQLEQRRDDRGFFARAFCREEFRRHGLETVFVQANVGFSFRRGTLRGMHYQIAPHEEAKLIRCVRGKVYDVIVDLREGSPTYLGWTGVELSAESRNMFFIPAGCAHGYLSLTDHAEVFYQVSQPYAPESERGIRYDDPTIGIDWPEPVRVISEKDRNWPLLSPGAGRNKVAET